MDSATLVLRKEFPGDWSDDLSTLCEQLLTEAEQLYGERDRTWTFLGVRWEEQNLTWPIDKDRKLASICLHKLKNHMPDFLPFNLAHETIHMLSPPDWDKVTYLEEGVAVSFSLTREIYKDPSYISKQQAIFEKNPENKYTTAWNGVDQLIKSKPGAITKLRLGNKSLSCVSATQILDLAPSFDRAVAKQLCERFNV
jgi:hypothetical protein